MLIPSEQLSQISPDPDTFKEKFNANCDGHQHVVSFKNLGGDSVLVSPCPVPSSSSSHIFLNYAHIALFMRNAEYPQIYHFWKKVGQEMLSRVQDDQVLWVSTSGLGVSWLHMRLDARPKYYTWEPYKHIE